MCVYICRSCSYWVYASTGSKVVVSFSSCWGFRGPLLVARPQKNIRIWNSYFFLHPFGWISREENHQLRLLKHAISWKKCGKRPHPSLERILTQKSDLKWRQELICHISPGTRWPFPLMASQSTRRLNSCAPPYFDKITIYPFQSKGNAPHLHSFLLFSLHNSRFASRLDGNKTLNK